ncbi:SGNH/GDSL hydrolase family protein [Aspergillus aculeatinus CBS 121060]|uniref:SGNH hydrolase n=1 Tax=Aspergillus aculeatinus CBS 121060 TaxID=1448322 RepID=A0ACD1GXJ9_9EURO|nr:SGNH hydrolase [Aspergillus aculeatinus CBS 121060]RAH65918.1 SGNH hydrolase [Aspergillus aculeatinus CBS 121060]
MIIFILLLCLLASHAVSLNSSDSVYNVTVHERDRPSISPHDFTWVKKWAAVGDSYTAGIGSGKLWSERADDRKCSRYDQSYPGQLKHVFGPQVKLFEYKACSGARTGQIFEQVKSLSTNLDIVVISAGGNDLCLADIIKTCIFLPVQGEDKCQEVLDLAQHNIDTILKPNIREIIDILRYKLSYNGMIVWVLYGQFFNLENEECSTKHDWSFPRLGVVGGLPLTVERRRKFNQLVININKAIRETILGVRSHVYQNPYIRIADWDAFVGYGMKGQFCVPGTTGEYPDPRQPYLHFFKPNTAVDGHQELRKREVEAMVDLHFDDTPGLLAGELRPMLGINTTNATTNLTDLAPIEAELIERSLLLNPRDPSPPNCPADSGSINVGLPDGWGKFFHPNEFGHKTIASFVLSEIVAQRAVIMQAANPMCQAADNIFKCWQPEGRKDYASADLMNANYKTFCKEFQPPTSSHEREWSSERWFNEQTPDTHWFRLTLRNGAKFDEHQCLESFDRVINSCDGNDPEHNPMNWKFGGRWVRGNYIYEVNVMNSFKRPWPVIRAVDGSCRSKYRGLWESYWIRGRGWSTGDFGQRSLLPSAKTCVGGGVTAWDLKYLNAAEEKDGMEWEAFFRTPVFCNPRCFGNNDGQFASGGFTHGC